MVNIFKKLFSILRNTNSKINNFKKSIEEWAEAFNESSKEDLKNRLIEVEEKYKEIFIKYKNKKNFTNITYSTDLMFGKLTKEEYDRKLIQFQKDVENAIIKVENKEMTYKAFFDLVHFNKR
ncbi:hypothetical protein CRU92_05320 [Arcobacter sp. FW59]|nr:hypothetical protein CRU92_05320 [Arcobacter sp. FW59]